MSRPSAARRAMVPPQMNSASSGCAITTRMRCPSGGSSTEDSVVIMLALLLADQMPLPASATGGAVCVVTTHGSSPKHELDLHYYASNNSIPDHPARPSTIG